MKKRNTAMMMQISYPNSGELNIKLFRKALRRVDAYGRTETLKKPPVKNAV